jgi:hypothetical protein
LHRQVNESFEAFRRSLQEMLSAEARRSVDLTLASIGSEGGPFKIEGVEVDVVIRDLRLATAGAASDPTGRRSARGRGAARPGKASADRRRGPRGNVRAALLAAFTDPDVQLDTSTLRKTLEDTGIAASTANVHQQLSRLVQSGELTREGRGVYRRAAAPAPQPEPAPAAPAEAPEAEPPA